MRQLCELQSKGKPYPLVATVEVALSAILQGYLALVRRDGLHLGDRLIE